MSAKHQVATVDLARERKFYDEAETVYGDIEDFKRKLAARNEEFSLLMEYYERHRGVLDVYNRPINGPRAMRPNLGTKDQTWYYLDGSGNKIWVRNLQLDTSDPKSGAFQGSESGDGRIVVVQVPNVRSNYNVTRDYRQKVAEFDASYRLPQSERLLRMHEEIADHVIAGEEGSDHHRQPCCHCSCHQQQQHQQHEVSHLADVTQPEIEHYISAQKQLSTNVERLRPSHRPEYVWRPPTTLEEAETRLRELKREAAELDTLRNRPLGKM